MNLPTPTVLPRLGVDLWRCVVILGTGPQTNTPPDTVMLPVYARQGEGGEGVRKITEC